MQQKTQLLELTSTRFFAAMAVLLGHFNAYLLIPDGLANFIAGGFGVSFFFVLSGFILCYRYWDTFAGGVAKDSFRRYFVARLARVYPSYALALALFTALVVTVDLVQPGTIRFPPDPVASWLVSLVALQTFAPTVATQQFWNITAWSISTEFAFYVFCPLLLAALALHCRGRGRLWGALALTLAFGIAMQSAALVAVLRGGWDREFWLDIVASRNIFWRGPEFVTGVIAARLLYGGHLAWLESANARNTLLAIGIATVLALNIAPWPGDLESVLIVRQFRLDLGYMIPFAAIIVALAAGPGMLSSLLKRPALVFLGDISYGIYIFHWIPWVGLAYAKTRGLLLHPLLVCATIVLVIAFSAASTLWFERPARAFLRQKFG